MNTNKTKKTLGPAQITVMLLIIGLSSGCGKEPKSSTPAQGSLSPQEYFSERIRLESGQPAVDIIQELYDELDFQRAVQAYVWATPFVAMSAMLEGLARDYRATLTRQPIFEQSVTPELVVFTGNNTTIYSFGHLELKKHGPIVLEAPAGALGGLDNHC